MKLAQVIDISSCVFSAVDGEVMHRSLSCASAGLLRPISKLTQVFDSCLHVPLQPAWFLVFNLIGGGSCESY